MTDAQSDTPPHAANWAAVLSIALAMFGLVSGELLPVSILTPMAEDLNVSIGAAGQAVTATAIVAAIASPVVILGAGRFDRRVLILCLTAALALSSLLAALSANYWLLLFARAVLGLALGGTWAMVTTLALRLVPAAQVPRAMAIIFLGVSSASVAAPALGAWLGEIWGWRGIFHAAAGVGLLALIAQAVTLPSLPPAKAPTLASFGAALTRTPVLAGLVTIMLVLTGQFAGFTYIRPLLEQLARLDIEMISLALLLFGIGGVVGSALGGALAARSAFLAAGGAAVAVTLAVASLAIADTEPAVAFVAVSLWGLAFSTFYVAIATWNAQAAPDLAESVGALQASSFQVSTAAGAALGGLAVEAFGLTGVLAFTIVPVLLGAAVMLAAGRRLQAASGTS